MVVYIVKSGAISLPDITAADLAAAIPVARTYAIANGYTLISLTTGATMLWEWRMKV